MLLAGAYQSMSTDRADHFELQKKRKAERPDEHAGWSYPAPWSRWRP